LSAESPYIAAEEFSQLDPPLPPVLPEWSPVATYGGYAKPLPVAARSVVRHSRAHDHAHAGYDFGGRLCWAF
jgi:hypothetical protein